MSEMVERVRLAIDKAAHKTHLMNFEGMARAAIEEMREPTDRMCNSGAAKWDDDLCTETNALNMWQAMADEARK